MDGHKQIWNYIPRVRWEGPLLNFVKGPLTFASESSLDGPETAERVYPQQRARQHSSKKKTKPALQQREVKLIKASPGQPFTWLTPEHSWARESN